MLGKQPLERVRISRIGKYVDVRMGGRTDIGSIEHFGYSVRVVLKTFQGMFIFDNLIIIVVVIKILCHKPLYIQLILFGF